MEKRRSRSIVSQMANSEIGSRGGNGMIFHRQPVMYFSHFIPSTKSEIEMNNTKYFHNQLDFSEFNQIQVHTLKAEICGNPLYESTHGSPFRVMKEGDEEYRPTYMPLLSDLNGYLHKGAGEFVKWLCLQQSPFAEQLIPQDVVPIFDLRFEINPHQICKYTLPISQREISMGAYNAGVHVMVINDFIFKISFDIYSCRTRRTGNRYFQTSIQSERANKFPGQFNFQRGSSVIIWNARDVHRPSFSKNMKVIVDNYSPLMVIITEARVRKPMMQFVRNELKGNYKADIFGPNSRLGGVFFLCATGASPHFSHWKHSLYDHVLAIDVIPSKCLIDIRPSDLSTGTQGLY